MDDRTCRECNDVFNDAQQLRRHLRKHEMTFQEYALKWIYEGIIPTCKCGCGQVTSWNVALKGYADFVGGHHAWGRQKSDDEKRKIGDRNRENMKRFMTNNPDIAKLRNEQMLAAHTPEMTQARLQATRRAYANMTLEDKAQFSIQTKKRWDEGQMVESRIKATQTFKQRSRDGEYDFSERNKKLSEAITQKYLDGKWKFVKGTYISTKTNKVCYYRSSWELQLMHKLDEDIEVSDWHSENISIPYEWAGAIHRYVPDFLVNRGNDVILIEVKPQSLRDLERNRCKREAAQAYCKQRGWLYQEWSPLT